MDLEQRLSKIEFQIEMLSRAVSWEDHPVESMVLEMNWDRDELDAAHDIFQAWDERIGRGEPIQHFDFEQDFEDKLGLGYQSVKSVVNAFWKNGQWVSVCEAFVDSMGANPSIEYIAIANRDRS